MKSIANLLFEARILKGIPRSGFNFLGSGSESVADHCFMTAFIGYVLSHVVPEADALRLLQMCLIHDLTEARIGDLNYVQKKYLAADESRAVKDLTASLPFGKAVADLIEEFNAAKTLEAQLAHDADQLSLVLELKALQDSIEIVIANRESRFVTVIGEAGVGKSRLLEEFENWLELQPTPTLLFKGRATLDTADLPYALLRDVFVSQFEILDDDPVPMVRKKITDRFREVLAKDEEYEMKAHFVGQLLGYDFRESP